MMGNSPKASNFNQFFFSQNSTGSSTINRQFFLDSVQDWSPHTSFILKGSQISVEGLVQTQDVNPRI